MSDCCIPSTSSDLPYDKRIEQLREVRRNIINHYTQDVRIKLGELVKIENMSSHTCLKNENEADDGVDKYIYRLEMAINEYQTDLRVNKQRLDKAKFQKIRAKKLNRMDEQDMEDYYSKEPDHHTIDG